MEARVKVFQESVRSECWREEEKEEKNARKREFMLLLAR